MRTRWLGAILGMVILAAGATSVGATGAIHAHARIVDASGAAIGWAALTEDATGRLHLSVHVDGLATGRHGIHIHAVGICEGPTFATAGGHHNPLGVEHGLDNPAGAHAGDLPNLIVNVAGRGRLVASTDRATLSAGLVSLIDADGSAIIIHANEDDQVHSPTGNSGGRIACGVIQAD